MSFKLIFSFPLALCLIMSLEASDKKTGELPFNHNDSIVITSDKALHSQDKSLTTFIGNVEADDGEAKLKCEQMEVFLNENSSPVLIICTEKVVILKETSVSFSDRAEYKVPEEKLILIGHAQVTRISASGEKNVMKGNKIIYDLKANTVEVRNSTIELKQKK